MKLSIASILLLASSLQAAETTLGRAEAMKAFEYLNKVRVNPGRYIKDTGVDLSSIKPQKKLKWNTTLARVAEKKAADMAKRNYFGHQTPEGVGINHMMHEAGYKLPEYMRKKKSANFFESIAAGKSNGQDTIKMLIVDKGVKSLGHRKHLLGMTKFWSNCKDIGIGFATNPKSRYRHYVVIIIAKQ